MHITFTGTAPLMMHNVRLADSLDPYTRQLAAISSKRKKTDDDRLEMSRIEFLGGLYHDEDMGPYIPAENVFRCLMNAATVNRAGKKIERGVIIQSRRIPLAYDGPREPEKMWGTGESEFVDRRVVAVMGKRIVRTRPIFNTWAIDFNVLLNPQVLDEDEFRVTLENAGTMIGLGDYRRFYGKFSVEVSDD